MNSLLLHIQHAEQDRTDESIDKAIRTALWYRDRHLTSYSNCAIIIEYIESLRPRAGGDPSRNAKVQDEISPSQGQGRKDAPYIIGAEE